MMKDIVYTYIGIGLVGYNVYFGTHNALLANASIVAFLLLYLMMQELNREAWKRLEIQLETQLDFMKVIAKTAGVTLTVKRVPREEAKVIKMNIVKPENEITH